MNTNSDRAIEFMLSWEKYLSEVPGDPGGKTIWGITSKYFPEIVAQLEKQTESESRGTAKSWYYQNVWLKNNCDHLPSPLDIFHFDSCVNPGPGAASEIMAHSGNDPLRYLLLRINYYKKRAEVSDSAKQSFRGWVNRVIQLFILYG